MSKRAAEATTVEKELREEEAAAEEERGEEEDVPLFMTRAPEGSNSGLQALAAIIDEDEDGDEVRAPPKGRRKRGIGEVQVAMALASCEPASTSAAPKRSRTTSEGT